MDIASALGFFGGCLVIVFSIIVAGASFGAFIDYPSVVCVGGGALAALLTCMPLKQFLSVFSVTKIVFFNKPPDLQGLIELIVSLAETARRDGLLALENRIDEIDNKFVVLGIQMAVDGTSPEVIEDIMRSEMESLNNRHRDGKFIFDQLGKFAPAWGMIGTLLGLVIMLGNMNDPAAIGPGMAVALLTTLYGAVLSNMYALPSAEKLNLINRRELTAMEIVIRGIMAIQSGDNPRVIEQKLSTFVSPKQRRGAKEEAA